MYFITNRPLMQQKKALQYVNKIIRFKLKKEIQMRLFVAVNFNESLRSAAALAVRELKSRADAGVFTHDENSHLTLAFIGETGNIKAAKEAVFHAAKNFKGEAAVVTTQIDRFRRGAAEGDIYFLGVAENTGLISLAESVAEELRARGFEIEKRAFKPHITLGRQVKIKASVGNRTKDDTAFDAMSAKMAVKRISLMKSERINGRLIYTEIYGANLILNTN